MGVLLRITKKLFVFIKKQHSSLRGSREANSFQPSLSFQSGVQVPLPLLGSLQWSAETLQVPTEWFNTVRRSLLEAPLATHAFLRVSKEKYRHSVKI